LLALADTADPDHETISRLLRELREDLAIPVLVISKVAFLLTRRLGVHAEVGFLADIVDQHFEVVEVE
jgi:predicted nucleic acid-binding protein